MKLSTSTNIVFERPDKSIMPMEDMMELAFVAGFDTFDISFYDWSLPHSPFLTDRWEKWLARIERKKDELGVSFGQCHAYTYNFCAPMTAAERARHEELVERSIYCCAALGSPLCVTHPETDFDSPALVKSSKEKNTAYFQELLRKTEKYPMAFAIENMCDYSIAPKRKYCATPEEMVDFVTSFDDERMGICWDFEHADIMKQDQRQSLLYIGKHLKATHVSDTHSMTDPDLMHVMPLFGTVNWKEVVQTLREIGYTGYFSFEANNYGNYFPDELLPTALRLAREIGEYLMKL